MSLKLSLDFQYTSTIEKVWAALTDSEKLAKWVLPNNFKPAVGQRFHFRAEPNEWWDGHIEGEVLIVDPPRRRTAYSSMDIAGFGEWKGKPSS